jgi:hypothetical protein
LLRLSTDDLAQLNAVCAKAPVLKRAAIARQALRLGLKQIGENPTLLLSATLEQ